jgi:trimeric autotransporter adhesin
MDAAQKNIKKISLFLATGLLLAAPFHASAQATLSASSTSVSIGSSSCNDSQTVTITSSGGSATPINFSVAVNYPNGTASGDAYGNWLYTTISNVGTTSTGTPFTSNTGTAGTVLTIGLNSAIGGVSDTGQVVVTDTSNLKDKVTITVDYAESTSCGGTSGSTSNNYISATPGTISLTAPTNGQAAQTVSIQNITGGGYAFTPSVTSSWLAVTSTALTISAGGTTSVNVTATASQTPGAGVYSASLVLTPQTGYGGGTLTVPVTFTVTSGTSTGPGGGSSGTLTINGATATTYTASINYVSPSTPGGTCVSIQDTAAESTSSYYYTQVTTTSGGSWLLANNQIITTTPGSLAPGVQCVNLTLNPTVAFGLSVGAYQGSVAITSSSGSTATINVNYYISAGSAQGITVSPGNIYTFPNVAPSSSVVQQQPFTVTAAQGYLLGAPSLTSSANGFSISATTQSNSTQSFTVTSNSAGLIAGVYTTTVTIPSSFGNGPTNTTEITIALPVGQSGTGTTGGGGTSTTTVVAPLSLAFQQQTGNSYWTSQKEAQAITITGAQGTTWSATIVYANNVSNWLTFDSASSGTFGSGPATLLVDLFNGVGTLTPSTTPYAATVSITAPSGTYSVSVSVLVTASNQAVLLGNPASATFAATTGTNVPNQTVAIVGSDNPSSTTSPPITAGTPTAAWLTATTSGNQLTLTVTQTGLSTGVYSATVPVSASAYANIINYPVVLIVNGGGGGTGTGNTGPLTLSTSSLPFTNVTGQLSQNLTVTASTSTPFTVTSSETNCTGASWLSVNTGTFTATSVATAISVTVNPTGITTGTTCNGVITLVSTGTNGGTQTVQVSMAVGTAGATGNVTVSPTTMTFAYIQNQTVPAAQTATIVNATSGTPGIAFTVAVSEQSGNSVTWLKTSVTSATTPYNNPGLSVSVAPGNLNPGTYNGTVTITPNGGSAQTIAVTLTVSANAAVSATPTTLSMTYMVGSTMPTATIQVSAGGSAAGFTATAASTGGWLQVSPTSGTTPNTGTLNLSVSLIASAVNALSASATPYTGSITVAGTSPATGTTIVNVSLTVTAPLPTITGITNAASGAVGPLSPGEIISIYGTPQNPIGPATAVQLNSTTCPSPCTVVPKQMGGVQVKFLPSGVFAPLLFVNEGQINAIVPYEVAGIASLQVEVLYLGQTSNAFPESLTTTAPGLFTANATGTGQTAAIQYDTLGNESTNLPATPAKAGWTLVLYMTGEGLVSPQPASGAVTVYNANANPPVPEPLVVPHVLIGNQPATVSFYGEAPGLVSGVMQLNVVVPAGAGTGAVPISVSMGTGASQAGVTVSLQ